MGAPQQERCERFESPIDSSNIKPSTRLLRLKQGACHQ